MKMDKSYICLNSADDNFIDKLNFALSSTGGSSDYDNSRERPYNGQPHTDQGERGKTLVKGLTMRDIIDCFVMGYLDATSRGELVDSGKWRYRNVYDEAEEPDPIAISQNMMCHVEKMMGIYPNIPDCVPTANELLDERIKK